MNALIEASIKMKLNEMIVQQDCYVQVDKGLTEVAEGTVTAAAWIEKQ